MPTSTSSGGAAAAPAVAPVPPRFQQGPITTALQLGPLAALAGTWTGNGFNAIWRPDNQHSQPESQIMRFLELNLTNETLEFDVIPGVVPNRGLQPQTDLSLYGLHYLQRVSDADKPPFETAGQALHLEPGLFMNVPATIQSPTASGTIVRMASIPHGVTLLMQGKTPPTTPVAGPPTIPSVFPITGMPSYNPPSGALGLGIQPFQVPPPENMSQVHLVPEVNIANDVAGSQSNGPFPPEFQGYINDPNSLLRSAIQGQDILGTITIQLSTTGVADSIGNIPFLGLPNTSTPPVPQNPSLASNAFASQAMATFWIEWVKIPGATAPSTPTPPNPSLQAIEPFFPTPTYLQLQYSQVVLLIFNKVLWPHVTVATLTLSAG
jgi:hypothetical protein